MSHEITPNETVIIQSPQTSTPVPEVREASPAAELAGQFRDAIQTTVLGPYSYMGSQVRDRAQQLAVLIGSFHTSLCEVDRNDLRVQIKTTARDLRRSTFTPLGKHIGTLILQAQQGIFPNPLEA